jgi:diguanylate cyclase (GGDEF)-like protein
MKFSPNLEADYQAELGLEKIRVLNLSGTMGSVLYLSFGALDLWTTPSAYHQVWGIRIVVIALTLAWLALAIWRPKVILSRYPFVIWTMYLTWSLGMLVMISISKPGELVWNSYYCGLMLVCSAIAVCYLGPLPTLGVGIANVVGYLVVAISIQDLLRQHWSLLLMNCCFLVSATVIGAMIANIRERHTRELYLLRHTLHRDVEVAKEAKRQSDFLAEHDVLTEMPNRIHFMRELESMITHAEQADMAVAVLFIDLNDFKPINDQHGHQFGDMVLRVVAQRIRVSVRVIDLYARLGGDEFVVAIELDQQHLASVDRLRQSLDASIGRQMGLDGSEVSVTASIGTAMYPFDAGDATELLGAADRRMYEIKRQSKSVAGAAMPTIVEPNVPSAFAAANSTVGLPW